MVYVRTIQLASYLTGTADLHRSTGDEEPLINAAIDRGRGQILALGDVGELDLLDPVGRVVEGGVGAILVLAGSLHRITQNGLTG